MVSYGSVSFDELELKLQYLTALVSLSRLTGKWYKPIAKNEAHIHQC